MSSIQDTCRAAEDAMTTVLFGASTPEERSKLESHLQTCAACREEHDNLKATLSVMASRQRKEPDESFWLDFEDRVVNRTIGNTAERGESRTGLIDTLRSQIESALFPKWALRTALAAAFLVVGIAIGRWALPSDQPGQRGSVATDVTADPVQGSDDVLLTAHQETANLLNRSELILLEFVNSDASATTNMGQTGSIAARRREFADNLVRQASSVRQTLDAGEERTLSELVRELEIVLVQIANLEELTDEPAVEIVRDAIDRRALLFRINREQVRKTVVGTPSSGVPEKPVS